MRYIELKIVHDFFDNHYSHASESYRNDLKKALNEYIKDIPDENT